jgi:uncharacterized linocin/CFP29 family protein
METRKIHDAKTFLANKDTGAMRPFIGKDGKFYTLSYKGGDKKDPKNYQKVPVANAALRFDEWRTLDESVIAVADQRLVGFDDLRRNNLTFDLGNAMGTTVVTYQAISDAMEALASIDPIARSKNDVVDHSTKHIPIPVIHSDYTLSERLLQESRNLGNPLDTSNSERAARSVAEKLEDMLFGSTSTMTYGGGTIYSYLTEPNRNQVSLGTAWDASGKTGEQIKNDVLAMKQASINDNYYGPWMLYVPTAYDTVLDDDYSVSGTSTQTIRQRIESIAGIQGVQVVDRLADDTIILVTMDRNVVDLIDGTPFQNIHWATEGGFVHNYKVMTIQVPRVKSDYANKSGVVVMA